MHIAILGTGAVGRALGGAFRAAGHDITVGTRDPDQTRTRDEWADSELPLSAYADLEAEVFVNSTNGSGSRTALTAVPAGARRGKVIIDASNPLDFAHGFPPSLFIGNTDSLSEQLQRALPESRVVKMFNTMANEVMVNPQALAEESTIFIAGNDDAARAVAAGLARDLGWHDVFDLGDLTAARGLEAYVTLWVRLYSQIGDPRFNIKVVRG